MKTLFNKPFLLSLIPLTVYLLLIILLAGNTLNGDEPRYILYAKNLLNGFYSPKPPDISLWNGPGYPLFVSIFLGVRLPLVTIKFANVFLYYFSIVFLYLSLKELNVSYKNRLICSAVLSFAFPYFLFYLTMILPEVYTLFLISIFTYLVISSRLKKIGYIILSGLILSLVILTKVLFAYVILFLLFFLLIVYFFKKPVKRYIILVFIAFIFTSPYLLYTYQLTGKFFYWSNSGGLSLYWMSTPYQNELGDWYGSTFLINDTTKYSELKDNDYFNYILLTARDSVMRANHGEFFKELQSLGPIKTDETLKRKAIKNIRNHPTKFIKNWIANVGRLFFHYPFSYRDQTINTFIVLIPSFILLLMFVFSTITAVKKWTFIPNELKILLLISLIYIGGSSLVSAYGRMFLPVIPVFLIWICYIFDKFIEIKIIKNKKNKLKL